jgi:(1->4)-alpha-D-glucan 1-alpha-D-glucosylmutase
MAKGVEDTAFYRYGRLLALNDVGGDPGRFGISVAQFHAANHERAARFPHNLLVTQTHDTKRSGDVRARIGALSTMAEEWATRVRRWLSLTQELDGPTDVERHFIFQTLAGAWPIERERMQAYMEKALREAKVTTNWVEPDEAHEAGVQAYIAALYEHDAFMRDFAPFVAELARTGDRHALAQLLLKLTVPGLPDIYQGDELLALSLVDPDNRRPVDWEARRRALDELRAGAEPTDDTRKLWVITRALELRARRAEAFTGAYEPLDAGERTVAFLRGNDVLAAAAVRGDGDPVELPEGTWRDVLSGGEHPGGARLDLRDGIALLERT